TTAVNPVFSFENACNYTGDILYVYISEDYDGTSNPTGFTWTPITVNLSSGSWNWVNAGSINLSSYYQTPDQSHVYIGFKYVGTSSNGKTWEIDNITVE